MDKIWSDGAWEDYLYWQTQDKKTLRRVNQLLFDIDRNGHKGIGKPEPLKHTLRYLDLGKLEVFAPGSDQ